MGCGSSSNAAVSIVDTRNTRPELKNSHKKNKIVPNSDSRATLSSKDNQTTVIRVSASSQDVNSLASKRREISATSTRTADSGICEAHEDAVITENSDGNKLEQASERPNTPELMLEGHACPRMQSGKERRRIELEKRNSESSVPRLPPLEDNSLMGRPQTRGGIKFDIMLCPETGNVKKAPTNLAKLEKRKRRKKMTKEELEEKMRRAAKRREEHRQKIIEKSQAFLNHYGNAGDHVKDTTESHVTHTTEGPCSESVEEQCTSNAAKDTHNQLTQDNNDVNNNYKDVITEEEL